MNRRELIALLGGAAAAWPIATRAQQPDGARRVGVLTGFAENDAEARRRIQAFLQRLQELGRREGRNLHIEYRWAVADPELVRTYAAELVALKPDVILVNSSANLLPLQRETRTIPIVFAQIDDPAGNGFVASLAHPGGNITGFTSAEFAMGGKLLEILKEVAPGITRAALIGPPDLSAQAGMWSVIEAASPSLGMQVTRTGVRDRAEIERAIDGFAREPNGGLIVLPNPTTNEHRGLIIALAARYRLPAIYRYRYFAADGGLVSYGADPADQYRQAASYVDRILKGEKPADLPVQQPTKFELVINLKTARALGLAVPPNLLVLADEVIE